ncbi:cell division protein FtsX [Desulfuromonas versatilis]|uniref:Cell division protein FtsX n=1 Tax=Desulfuromonas versatilis TaxID=2802975 RepID=A0ABN6E0B5_9BACT|nr:permease-like cell division protein FtsX [Desulfuromonas versatilis]BCR05760.1 cell division protein FtsX [Desulfuromonas versatilis]
MLERLVYFFLRALRNMRQSPFICSVAVGTVAVALTIMAFFAIVVLNVQQLTSRWSQEVEVTAYFEVLPPKDQIKTWIGEIEALPQVERVTFVTSQEAFARFRERLGSDAELLEGMEADFLPASLEISLQEDFRNPKGVEALVASLRQKPALSDLHYGQQWLERFEAFVSMLKVAGAILGGFLLFAALFIVSNTIKLTIYARRDELEVMALVGATSMFIKTPFLIEGAFQGALGGLLSLGGTYALFQIFLKKGLTDLLLVTNIGGVSFLPTSFQFMLVSAGVALGLFGSLMSLRKFVRI